MKEGVGMESRTRSVEIVKFEGERGKENITSTKE